VNRGDKRRVRTALVAVLCAVAVGMTMPPAAASKATVSSLKGKVNKLQEQLSELQQQFQSFQQQVGPQGPQGTQGPQGVQGPPGTSGSADTPAQVLAKLAQVDGSGSGLDADLLDGLSSGDFVQDTDTAAGDIGGPFSNLTVGPNAVALQTDTTGNYVGSVATPALSGLTGGAAGSEGAALSLGLDYSSSLAGNPPLATDQTVFGTEGLMFEGTGPNNNEALLTVLGPTADRTITLPNDSGFVLLQGNVDPFSPEGTTNPDSEGLPLLYRAVVSNGADTGIGERAIEVVDAWSVATTADGGTWTVEDASGNDITNAVTVPTTDRQITRATLIDDAFSSPGGGPVVINATGSLDANVYILGFPE
jgi:hypothetical protein